MFCHPVRVLLLRLGHDDDLVAGLAAERGYVAHGPMLEGVLPRVCDVGRDAVLVPDVFEFYFNDKKEDGQEDGGAQGEAQGQPHYCSRPAAGRNMRGCAGRDGCRDMWVVIDIMPSLYFLT